MKEWAVDAKYAATAQDRQRAFELLIKRAAAAAAAGGSTVSRISIPRGLFAPELFANIMGNTRGTAAAAHPPPTAAVQIPAGLIPGLDKVGGEGSSDGAWGGAGANTAMKSLFVPGKSLEQQSKAGPFDADIWIDHGQMYKVVSPRVLKEQGFTGFVDSSVGGGANVSCTEKINNAALERLFASDASHHSAIHTFFSWDSF